MKDNFTIILGDKKIENHNVVTSTGRDLIRMNPFHGGRARQLGWVHLGTVSDSRENPDRTTLDTDIYQSRWTGINVVNRGLDCFLYWDLADNVGLSFNAAGIFIEQSPSSVMYALSTFDEITKTDDKFLIISWRLRWENYYQLGILP